MLKHRAAAYGVGRTRDAGGGWHKWKIDPLSVDCVLVYAQRGHGRRASLYTDYTFAVWDARCHAAEAQRGQSRRSLLAWPMEALAAAGCRALVPFAKAYSGLTDAEIRRGRRLIRSTTIEKFGPVRSVVPRLVVELGFEGIQASPRHKSGIAVRFPRILRVRNDKPLHEADTLDALQRLLARRWRLSRASAVSAVRGPVPRCVRRACRATAALRRALAGGPSRRRHDRSSSRSRQRKETS